MYMNRTAIKGLRDILTETYEQQGWSIPNTVVDYETKLFAEHIDRVPWQPEPSYAERYLQIRTVEDAWRLADTCFFTRAVFPELGERRGIKSSYYVDLGQGCYGRVLQEVHVEAVELMCKHFEFLAEAAYTAIRHYGSFRTMWD